MASSNGRKKGREERQKRSRVTIALVIAAALILFYLIDPAGFRGAMTSLFGGEQAADASPAAQASPGATGTHSASGGVLEVYFIDVGQGDCIFLRSPNGKTMLVDTGESQYYEAIESFLAAQGVTKLDAVVETHPHSDHMGGMDKVILNYDIGVFYASPATNNTTGFEKMLDALEEKKVETVAVYADEAPALDWDEDVTVRVLSPFSDEEYDLNNASIVLNVIYGDTSVLLTGDAETAAEKIMLERLPASYFRATILKLGHHGSNTSTSDAFLEAVSPQAIAIEVGEGNDYGHPHAETLELLEAWGGPVYRTDLNGTIRFILDGSGYTVTAEK